MKIDDYRKEIDILNKEIVEKLERRFKLSREIGKYKEEHGLPVYDAQREKQVLNQIRELSDEESSLYIERIFLKIMEESREYQKGEEAMSFGDDDMNILVINGPNMNMLGIREPDIYGTRTYQSLVKMIENKAKELKVSVSCFQSNSEGEIVDAIQKAYGIADGIIINPAAYTHTSIAIADAIRAVDIPTVEVHISDVSEREEYRKISYVGECCIDTIQGEGYEGYNIAMEILKDYDIQIEKKGLRMKVNAIINGIIKEYPEYRSISSKKITNLIEAMPEYAQAQSLFLYAGTEREIDTENLIRDSLREGKTVALPLCAGEGIMEAAVIESFDDLVPGKFGILEPKKDSPRIQPEDLDFILVPCLTGNLEGNRLGYGGGYYDRFLDRTKGAKVLAVREKVIETVIPMGSHDKTFNIIVTENGITRK